jgi:hypothetical protein
MNNRGWGLSEMLALTFILIGALLLASIIVVNNLSFLVSKDDSESFKAQYQAYENELEEAAKDYVLDTYPNRGSDLLIINYDTLKTKEYIAKMMDPNKNIECDGYVRVEATNYQGYLSCFGSYKTTGYDTNK